MNKVKLLVVDDEEGICDFIKSFFQEKGLEVSYALSGKEALEVFKKEHPQIILLDVLMKGMDGLETLKQIKQIDQNNYVFMLTRVIDDLPTLAQALALGAKDYLKKPLILEDLEAVIMPLAEKIKQQ
jgi:DNA-binding response OmpR family regulator